MSDPFSWSEFLSIAVRVIVAYALAVPMGWERESSVRSLGLRTFPLVSLASAGYILIGIELFGAESDSQARLIQGLITGIGFIGGGAILKGEETVRGTATAASIWATGAIGAASAYGHYEIALLVAVITFATLRWMTPIKENVERKAGIEDKE